MLPAVLFGDLRGIGLAVGAAEGDGAGRRAQAEGVVLVLPLDAHGDVFLLHLVGGRRFFGRRLDVGGGGSGRLLGGLLLRLGFFGLGFFGLRFLSLGFFGLGFLSLGFFGLGFLSLGFFLLGFLGLGFFGLVFFFLLGFVGLDVFGLLLGRFLDLLLRHVGLLFDILFGLFVGLVFFFLLRLLGLRFFRHRHRRGRGLLLLRGRGRGFRLLRGRGFRLRRGRGFRLLRGRGFRLLHGRGRFLLRRFFLNLLLDHLDDFGVPVRLRVLGKAGHAARDAQRRREHHCHNLVPTVFHLEKPPSDWFRSIV